MKKIAAAFLALCLVLLSGCGGAHLYKEIHAYDFFSREKTEFEYLCRRAYGDIRSTPFTADSLDGIAQRIEAQLPDVTKERFPASILLGKREASGTSYLLILNEQGTSYVFFGMGAMIGDVDVTCIFPFHLLDLQKSSVYSFGGSEIGLEEQEDYVLLESTREDFLHFYRECNQYSIAETDDGFILTGYTFPNAKEFYPPFPKQIIFHFGDTPAGAYCRLETKPVEPI